MIQARNIDFTTYPHIVAIGSHAFPGVSAGDGQTYEVSIPTQENTNYTVVAGFQTNSPGYAYLTIAVHTKTTTSFKLEVWNSRNASAQGPTVDWVLVRND